MLLKASKLSVELIKYISAFVTEGTFHFLIDRWGRTLNDYVKSPERSNSVVITLTVLIKWKS